jgi:hypothetical protein
MQTQVIKPTRYSKHGHKLLEPLPDDAKFKDGMANGTFKKTKQF